MTRFSLFPALLTALAVAQTPIGALHAQPTPAASEPPLYTSFEVIDMLQKGGLVMIIRHERTEMPSRSDDYTRPPTECRAQRNLSVAGVVSAYETGHLLREAGIPVSRVITSPMCRSAETARYMFGVEYETDNRLMHHDPGENSQRPLEKAAQETRAVVSDLAPVDVEGNVAIVSHGGNIFKGTGLRLTEGEVGVLSVDETGVLKPLGQFTGSTLGFYTRSEAGEAAKSAAP